jgi:indoleamine 2,3-dioxygenase
MLSPPSTNLTEHGISTINGFLPHESPLEKLSDDYYLPWELVIAELPQHLHATTLRTTVDRLPVLSTSKFKTEPEWRRGYLILSFLTHAYIWEAGGPSQVSVYLITIKLYLTLMPFQRLPPCISVPFLQIATHLCLPPTATYAALNLWNFAPLDPNVPLSNIENLRTLHTFTGTPDESWFYLISVSIESHGASLIPMMLRAMEACSTNDSDVILSALSKFADVVQEIGVLLKRMDESCDPLIFYNKIRPFLAGSKNMGVAGLPNGVFYDEGNGEGGWRTYSGGSNAQSSLIQFFDIILGVDHDPKSSTKPSKGGFLKVSMRPLHCYDLQLTHSQEMRTYMPGPHREFLNILSSIPSPIREYCHDSPIPEVVQAFNFAVEELAAFRDIHIQIVTRYIILPARMQRPQDPHAGLNLAVASNGLKKGLCGTGGTELLPFLKGSRDETRDAALK